MQIPKKYISIKGVGRACSFKVFSFEFVNSVPNDTVFPYWDDDVIRKNWPDSTIPYLFPHRPLVAHKATSLCAGREPCVDFSVQVTELFSESSHDITVPSRINVKIRSITSIRWSIFFSPQALGKGAGVLQWCPFPTGHQKT